VSIGGVKMVVGWLRASGRSEAAAVFFGHSGRDRRVIFYNMSVAVDDLRLLRDHVSSPFSSK